MSDLVIDRADGYTQSMKVAVSIPDPLFADADAMAHQLGISRSKLYARSLGAYLASHAPDRLTESWNAVLDDIGPPTDPLLLQAAYRVVLDNTEW